MGYLSLTGHFWTLAAHAWRTWAKPEPPTPARPWSVILEDPDVGRVRLTGWLTEPQNARAVVVLVHGLGGSADSPYVRAAANQVVAHGLACLRLHLRGADRRGEDIYHAGLIDDLTAALASPAIEAYDDAAILGFSLGGHVALRWAVVAAPPRLRAVAAVCPPLDLAMAARAIDRSGAWLYRRHLLRHLREIYRETCRRRPQPAATVARVERTRTFVEFDSLVIAPRFGFADAWDYYARMSIGPDLERIEIPGLVVAARHDPMIPASSLEPFVRTDSDLLEYRCIERGGHLGFPPGADLGLGSGGNPYAQIIGWLANALGTAG